MQGESGSATSTDDLIPGKRVGKYILRQRLGAGAMGVVFAAEHEGLGREVAIKVLRAEFAENADVVERFQREAEAVSRIGHTNIVSVYDFGRLADGSVYYVMEKIAGETLTARLRHAPAIEPDETVHVVSQICRALQATHARGVVHRDLKPDNIMLLPQKGRLPHVKVVDFGVAKMREAAEARQKTAAGTVLGTPAFMAPEQISAVQNVDGRADIYAVGAIVYVILTGRLVFEGEMIQVLLAQMQDPVIPPRARAPEREIPPAVEAVVMRALSKTPGERQPDAATFAAELEAAYGPRRAVTTATPAVAYVAPDKSIAEQGTVAAGALATAIAAPAPAAGGQQTVAMAPGAATAQPQGVQASQATMVAGPGQLPTTVAPPKSRGALYAALGGLALVAVGGLGFALSRRGGTNAGVAGSASQAPAPAATSAPAAVRSPLEIEAEKVLGEALGGGAVERRAALDAIAVIGDRGAIDQVMTALGDDNPEVRRAAAFAAAAVGQPGDKALLAALGEAAGRSVGAVAVDVAAARLRVGDATAEEELRRAVDGRDPAARLRAALALADAGKLPAAALHAALDASPKTIRRSLRQAAQAKLVKMGDAPFAAGLTQALAGADAEAQLDAAQALARNGDAAGVSALVRLATAATDPVERVEAASVLAELNEAHGRPALLDALAAPTAAVRVRAATGLGRLWSAPVPVGNLPLRLTPLLKDPDPQARAAAAAALIALDSAAHRSGRNQ